MSTWDIEIFSREANTDFLDELATLDDEDIVEAVEDSCKMVLSAVVSRRNGAFWSRARGEIGRAHV